MKELDEIEKSYIWGIQNAQQQGDNDLARELAVGLRQYREFYK